jgi:hypothetical protein
MSHQVSNRGVGGAIFAATLLLIAGALWCIQGLAGIVKGTTYVNVTDSWITTNAGTWGWTHLLGGLIAIAAGLGVMSGAAWARFLGILIAAVSILVNFAFIPQAPWWAFTIIVIDLWVIHSLFVHRRIHD